MVDVSTVNISTLPSLPVAKRRELPNCPAVYFAISESREILYIGRSRSLVERWRAHHRIEQFLETPVLIAWLSVENSSELNAIERALIRRFSPPLNDTDQPGCNGHVILSFRVTKAEKDRIAEESALRGHTVSEAAEKMLRLGMPRYLKQIPKKFERVESAA